MLPFKVAVAVWLALTGLAAAASYFALARMLGAARAPGTADPAPAGAPRRGVLLPVGHAVGELQPDRPRGSPVRLFGAGPRAGPAAGLWLALAVALKLLPCAGAAVPRVGPALARVRVVPGVLAPVLGRHAGAAFGFAGAEKVYRGWAVELTRATDAQIKTHHPILISLDKAALHAFAGDAERAKLLSLAVCGCGS